MAPRAPRGQVEAPRGVAHARRVNLASAPVVPHDALSRFVHGVRVLTRAPEQDSYVRLPNGEVDLIVRNTASGADVYALGTRLQMLRKPVSEVPPGSIGLHFKPGGAYPFFGVPISELTNRVVPIEALWSPAEGQRLRERLSAAPSVVARMDVLRQALIARLRRDDVYEPASAHLVLRAVRLLSDARELPRVDALARTVGVSERQLRRAFDEVVGMGPKAYARIVRFQRAVRASRLQSSPDWGTIATAVGYYDQAHLIADFRALTGTTPGSFSRGRHAARTQATP
ncbi:AraC family transcriptional regulator [Corallococcus sp. M34]|uniref:helix-turn-helix domain-containing protein n=1 Tax=Citreicoccus inhibens TaxID=2849499 RepID=UPI001C227342|nr:AraC family transcriptional regulator [Citreicoccus inhibens]MBU8894748.1 AraC family transcriptional regulator [Citreicoccus inhibens]